MGKRERGGGGGGMEVEVRGGGKLDSPRAPALTHSTQLRSLR